MATFNNRFLLNEMEIPVPCQSLLRILAVWQPHDALLVFKLYNTFGNVIAVSLVCGVLYAMNMDPKSESWIDWLNNISTLTVLGLPFVLIKWFLRCYGYHDLIRNIRNESDMKYERCKNLLKKYVVLAGFLWLFGTMAGIVMFLTLLSESWLYSPIVAVIIFGNGWWACWLTIYGTICHIHLYEIKDFLRDLQEAAATSIIVVEDLLQKFNTLRDKIEHSQEKLHVVISIPVALHLMDTVVYTIAYFQGQYDGKAGILKYPAIPYVTGMAVDLISIFIKFVPAALVSSALHQVVIDTGKLCVVGPTGKIDKKCFHLHQYFFVSDQDLGYKILGVKITMRLFVTVLTTLITIMVSVLRYVQYSA